MPDELGSSAGHKIRKRAREQAGVLLPDVDPVVGEMLLTTIYSNPDEGLATVLLGLMSAAPPALAPEILQAALELVACKVRGEVVWLETEAQAILMGIRSLNMKSMMAFGHAKWPMRALYVGPPKMVRVMVHDSYRDIWTACEGLDGAVVRMSEVVALGQILIEAHGGRVIEDRSGPEVMQRSFIEENMSQRARRRAMAKNAVDNMTIGKKVSSRSDHARVALAESVPGLLKDGDRVMAEHDRETIFEVERRVNDDYVIIVSVEPKAKVAPGRWLYEDERHPTGIEELGNHVGFTDDVAEVR